MNEPTDQTPQIEPPDLFTIPRSWVPRVMVPSALVLVLLAVIGMWQRYRLLEFDPASWQEAGGLERGRMLKSLLDQTDFIEFTRSEVNVYLGSGEFDERVFWYDLGAEETPLPVDPRADVGDPARLYGVFRHERRGTILEVLYNHRRPTLGSEKFDSTGWFAGDPAIRRTMFTNALGRVRARGLSQATIFDLLGPPGGTRLRTHYDVGMAGSFYGVNKALILEYNANDVVVASHVTE